MIIFGWSSGVYHIYLDKLTVIFGYFRLFVCRFLNVINGIIVEDFSFVSCVMSTKGN